MEGKVIIFSAPSGAGKTTLSKFVLQSFPQLEFSVSATTRLPRAHETHGKDYYFISIDEFKKLIQQNAFVEWEEVYNGSFYGTLKSEVDRIWAKNHHVVFDVDVKGGINLKKIFGHRALSIFIMPPSIDILEKRLRKRDTESEEMIKKRVLKAFKEIDDYKYFDKLVLNDRLEKSKKDIYQMIQHFLEK
ncbi:MAG: guanylate kinase [Flavobacteriales bacterium]|nr:guanylate kinase [Flavobacteriales bacterium]